MTMTNDSYAGYCACICRNSRGVLLNEQKKSDERTEKSWE